MRQYLKILVRLLQIRQQKKAALVVVIAIDPAMITAEHADTIVAEAASYAAATATAAVKAKLGS